MIETLKALVEALFNASDCTEYHPDHPARKRWDAALDAGRALIAQMEAEQPVLIVEREPDYWSRGHFHEGRKPHIDPTKVWALPIGTRLYAHPQPTRGPSINPISARYTVERHGNGWAIYQGRDNFHHGFNLGQLTETTQDIATFIERALNAHPHPTREPIHGADIAHAFGEHVKNSLAANLWSFAAGVRWAEQQHGITGEKR